MTQSDSSTQSQSSAAERDVRAEGKVLVDVRNLVKHFPITRGILFQRQVAAVRAVDGVSFQIDTGETLGLVGESGCGKSTTGRVVLRFYPATSGEVWFDGVNVNQLSSGAFRSVRRKMQMIFQDPFASLNPRQTVGQIVGEPLIVHGLTRSTREREERVQELLRVVGLNPYFVNRYPHEFSGGQRQRIGIARALAVEPRFLVLDEPISALDVSIRAQIVNLLEDLQQELKLTYLFIAHDLSVVRHISNRIAVMYLGKIVEVGDRDALCENPLHPYTRALLSAVPVPDPEVEAKRQRILLTGDVPSPVNPPSGCRFHPRCPWARSDCANTEPPLTEVLPGQFVACHYWDRLDEKPGSPSVGASRIEPATN